MRDSEHIEAVALMRWAALNEHQYPELKWLFHIPNGGARGNRVGGKYRPNLAAAGKLKAEGVKRGVSDYLLPAARGEFHGLFLELKAEKGRTTPDQREFIADMQAAGYRAEVVRGWNAAREIIVEYLNQESGR